MDARARFMKTDKDGSGLVDKEEFMEMISKPITQYARLWKYIFLLTRRGQFTDQFLFH